jgi:hypothetical protein
MRLWRVTNVETKKFIYVLAERWADVRSFSSVHLQTCGDFTKLNIEASAPFSVLPGKKKVSKLRTKAFRLEWRGTAASNPSTLGLVIVACKTVEELYGQLPAPKKPGKKNGATPKKAARRK